MKTNTIVNVLIVLIITFMVICFILGMYFLERKINYTLSYRSMVQTEIKNLVKKECLK